MLLREKMTNECTFTWYSHRNNHINLTKRIIPLLFVNFFTNEKTILIFSAKLSFTIQKTLVLFSLALFSFIGFAQVKDTTTVNKLDEVLCLLFVLLQNTGSF
jgi:hypothetical protein